MLSHLRQPHRYSKRIGVRKESRREKGVMHTEREQEKREQKHSDSLVLVEVLSITYDSCYVLVNASYVLCLLRDKCDT